MDPDAHIMLWDATHIVREGIPVYPGDDPLSRRITAKVVFHCEAYSHAGGLGTHVDAPRHFFAHLAAAHELPLPRLWRRPLVIVSSDTDAAADALVAGCVVLFRSGRCALWSSPADYCRPSEGFPLALARRCVEVGAYGIGIDELSIDSSAATDYPVHRVVLGAGLWAVENVNMSWDDGAGPPAVGATISVVPSRIAEAPEAPARVVIEWKKN